jgi:hypothetical protein
MNDFFKQVDENRKKALESIRKVPIACLIWGPNDSSGTPTANCRKMLKEELTKLGHYACYSEDLFDPNCDISNLLQQAAQAEAFDIVFSIPDSPGSIAEIHQFARVPFIGPKIVAYLDSSWNGGFANKALIDLQSPATCKIQPYQSKDLPYFIINDSIDFVKRLQEAQYLNGRRQ